MLFRSGYEKYISQIEAQEKKREKLLNQQRLLAAKIENLIDPWEDLPIVYPPNNSKRIYSKTEDKFLLNCVYKFGINDERLNDKIKHEIANSDVFKFDWFIQSRTSQEIGRRVNTLLLAITREMERPAMMNSSTKRRKLMNGAASGGGGGGSSNASSRVGSVEPSVGPMSDKAMLETPAK